MSEDEKIRTKRLERREVWLKYRLKQEDGFKFPRLSLFQEKDLTYCQDFKSLSSQAVVVHPGRIIPSCLWMNVANQCLLWLNNIRTCCITPFTPLDNDRTSRKESTTFGEGKKENKKAKFLGNV